MEQGRRFSVGQIECLEALWAGPRLVGSELHARRAAALREPATPALDVRAGLLEKAFYNPQAPPHPHRAWWLAPLCRGRDMFPGLKPVSTLC